jgi:hypothetical protein
MSGPRKPINPNLKGGYSERLTKRVPRKRIAVVKPIKYNKPYLSDYDLRLIKFRFAFEKNFGFNIFKTKGQELHVFLPMTSMSPQGHLLKSFFEQILPLARVTFLVTPNTDALSKTKDSEFRRKALNNLENHLRRSLNIHDKYFVCFDYIDTGKTQINIMQKLNKIYNREVNYIAVKSPEGGAVATHLKEIDGSSIRLYHSKTKTKNIIQEHYNAGIELSRNKQFVSKLLE